MKGVVMMKHHARVWKETMQNLPAMVPTGSASWETTTSV
jgi:hypothetical protein